MLVESLDGVTSGYLLTPISPHREIGGFQNFSSYIELIFKLGEVGVAFNLAGDFGDEEFLHSWKQEAVDLLAADHEEVPSIGGFFQIVEGTDDGDAGGLLHGAGEDDVLPAGERFTDRRVSFPSHEDGMTHGGRLEEFEIFGEMPRDRPGIADDPVLRHGDDGFDHL